MTDIPAILACDAELQEEAQLTPVFAERIGKENISARFRAESFPALVEEIERLREALRLIANGGYAPCVLLSAEEARSVRDGFWQMAHGNLSLEGAADLVALLTPEGGSMTDPDYSPEYQDAYATLWHRDAEFRKAYELALARIDAVRIDGAFPDGAERAYFDVKAIAMAAIKPDTPDGPIADVPAALEVRDAVRAAQAMPLPGKEAL